MPGGGAFSVGLSSDEGRTFVPRYRLPDLAPLACGAGTTTGDRCAEDWPAVEATLGIGDAGPDAGGDAASDGAPGDASTTTTAKDDANDGGCGCDLARSTREGAPSWFAALVVASTFVRRRVVAKS